MSALDQAAGQRIVSRLATPRPVAVAQPPAAGLDQALRDLLEAVESMQGTFGCIRGETPEDDDLHTHDKWAEEFLQERAQAAIAVLATYDNGRRS